MCKIFLLFSAAGLEVRVTTNPTMRKGISSSPHSSHLVLSLSLSGEMELQLIDINSAQDLWLERSWDLGESGNLIWLGRIDSPPAWQGGKGFVVKMGLHNVLAVCAVLYIAVHTGAGLNISTGLIWFCMLSVKPFLTVDAELHWLWLLCWQNNKQSAILWWISKQRHAFSGRWDILYSVGTFE